MSMYPLNEGSVANCLCGHAAFVAGIAMGELASVKKERSLQSSFYR